MALVRTLVLALIAGGVSGVLATYAVVSSFDVDSADRSEPVTVDTDRSVLREESAVIQAVQAADPAVVSVIVTRDLPIVRRYYEGGSLFDQYFGIPRYEQEGTQRREVGGGTAFFVSADGLLMTNKHVVADEQAEYTVLLNNGKRLEAEVVARHPSNDIAFLQVEGSGHQYVELSPDEPQLAQTVIAIGNALAEYRNTVSVGVVSGLSRSLVAGSPTGFSERLDQIIQTDAAINSGNSGGPLIDIHGRVLGMNTAMAAGAQNIGFAIAAADLRNALQSYQEHGRIVQAYLGVRYVPITPELAEENSLPYDYGMLVVRGETQADLAVVPGSPADKAGITENTILLEVNGERLTLEQGLASVIQRLSPGDTVELRLYQQGEEQTAEVTLEEMPQ